VILSRRVDRADCPHVFALLAGLCFLTVARAQDRFEIHVYEYEPLSLREYSLEAHLNVQPNVPLTHVTLEPTFGISENFALGFMFLNASTQFAGWRILPHFYAPEDWRLPFRLGLVAEFSFQKALYEENTRRVELRPILDREFTRWQIVGNPVVERALHGPGTRDGWIFSPAVLVRLKRKVFSPSVEYYGELGPQQVHQLFLGGDWHATEMFSINLGTGFDLSPAGPGLILKSRLEWDWHK
jgi:hypothetical protein